MGLPHNHLTPSEVAFLCESEPISIIPRQRLDALSLISVQTPALIPPQRNEVPLWIAVLLKRQRRCNIVPPDWLNVENLELLVKLETDGTNFMQLPWRWLEVAEILLDVCPDDIESPTDISLHIRSLRELRQAKIRRDLANVMNSAVLSISNLGFMEVCEIRPWVGKVVDGLRKIEGDSADALRRKRTAAAANEEQNTTFTAMED